VALDIPFSERSKRIEVLVREVGGLSSPQAMLVQDEKAESPLHMVWNVQGARGALHCEIWLSPKTPSLIQKFDISKETA
jgi:hypothetical protein